jgi:hypothetical protein
VKDVIQLFLKPFNEKNLEHQISIDEIHLQTEDGNKIFSNDIVSIVLEDSFDYYIRKGYYIRKTTPLFSDENKSMLKCKNYGCNKLYKEEENTDASCVYHSAPPIFHDTMKCWSCCRERKAYDFETFQLIEGCSIGKHSDIVKKIAIAESPSQTNSEKASTSIKSIADFNTKNPDAVSSVAAAVKLTVKKSSRLSDGTAKCQRKGCQKSFVVSENSNSACIYHVGQPVFHDAVKFWSCCPDKKCFDFDEFLAVPGCGVGLHDDGEIELV